MARSSASSKRRLVALLLVALALAPGTWLRETMPPPDTSGALAVRALPLPLKADRERLLGLFRLQGIWQLGSPDWRFGGYSSLVAKGDGMLLAIGDRGQLLSFAPPGSPPRKPRMGPIRPAGLSTRFGNDAESATYDRASGNLWIGWESSNSISRHGTSFDDIQVISPPAMRDWGVNVGPEAMLRLADGRFVVLREGADGWFGSQRHRGLIFASDPISAKPPKRFTFAGPDGFSPVDMAQLPDGRVLILMRRLAWPIPLRFEGRIALADPGGIRPGAAWRARAVASLASPLPVDNFEGMAIEPHRDGKVTVWLISDANAAVTQRTLLWKLMLDPAELGASKRARRPAPRPSAK